MIYNYINIEWLVLVTNISHIAVRWGFISPSQCQLIIKVDIIKGTAAAGMLFSNDVNTFTQNDTNYTQIYKSNIL